MNVWRDMIKQIFYDVPGLFPTRLGARVNISFQGCLVYISPPFSDMLLQSPARYLAVLGDITISNDADQIYY